MDDIKVIRFLVCFLMLFFFSAESRAEGTLTALSNHYYCYNNQTTYDAAKCINTGASIYPNDSQCNTLWQTFKVYAQIGSPSATSWLGYNGQRCWAYSGNYPSNYIGFFWGTGITAYAPCPANSTGTNGACTCSTNYMPNATQTSCIQEHYTIALSGLGGEVMPTKKLETAYALVTKSDGSAKSGAQVSLSLTVVPEDDGQLYSAHVGAVSPNGGSTGADGRLSFVFTAPVAGGTHTITATCTNCTNNPVTGTIKVPGCGVPELRKVEDILPNGSDVLPLTRRLETTLGADLALLPDAQAGVTCITNKYPSASISSGTRTEAYQAHLKEIWDKSEELELPKNKNNAACKSLREKVNAAKGCSGGHCIVFPPAEVSDHPTGKAFDVSRDTINGLRRTLRPALPPGTPPLTEEQQHQADIKLIADWLASPAACNLVWGGSYGDIVHFSIP